MLFSVPKCQETGTVAPGALGLCICTSRQTSQITIEVHTELVAEEVVAATAPLNIVITAPATETAAIPLKLAEPEVPEEEFDGIYLDGDEFEDMS